MPTFSPIQGSAQASASLVVAPMITLSVGYLGGPQVIAPFQINFNGNLQCSETVPTVGSSWSAPSGNVDYSVDASINLLLGGAVDISIAGESLYQHSWTPSSVYNNDYQIVPQSSIECSSLVD